MERQRSASLDRQKSAILERRRSSMSTDRQKSAVSSERQKSGLGARSSSMGNLKSATFNRSNSKLDKPQPAVKKLEFPCTPCERDSKAVEASNYCSDCAENLCADCVKQHQKFPAMKGHKILGKKERRKDGGGGGSGAPGASPLECEQHPGRQVEMYCEDHNEIWCGACIAVNHRKCKNTMLMEKAAVGVLQSDEFRDVKENVKLVRKDLVALRKKADTNLNKLEKQKAAVLNKIKAYRQKINQALDKLEAATVKELDQAVERGRKYAEEDRQLYSDMVATLDAVLTMVVKTKGNDQGESAVFVGVKRAKQKMVEGQRIINFTKNSAIQEAFRFVPDPQILDWLKSLKQLGSFPHQQKSYAGVLIGKYNVRTKTDSSHCDIFGCAVLPDGRVLLGDWDNRCVKLLDRDYTVVDTCILPGSPVDLCTVNPQEAVASLTLQKTLQFLHIDSTTVTATRTLAVEEHCRGVAYHDGQVFVVCGGFKNETEACIRVFSIEGEPVGVITTNNRNQKIFASPIAISIDVGGTLYHITDGQRGVITMTSSNDVVSMISNKDVGWPCGICLDREGNAIICNGKTNNIIQMSTLAKFTTILQYEDGIKNPHSVCFDQNNMRLIVTSKCNTISVYQLQARDMAEVAKDVRPTVPEPAKTELEVPKADTSKKEDEKQEPGEINIIEEALKLPDTEKTKPATKKGTGKKSDKQGANAEEDKKLAFVTMAEKILSSQQVLRAIQEVTKANTAPENGPKAEAKAGKQAGKKPADKKVELPQIKQTAETSNKPKGNQQLLSRQQTVADQATQSETSESLPPTKKSTDSLLAKRPDTRQSRDSAVKPNKRPLTASTDSTRSKPRSQTSEGKPKTTNLPAINSITPRTKEKTQLNTARTNTSLTKANTSLSKANTSLSKANTSLTKANSKTELANKEKSGAKTEGSNDQKTEVNADSTKEVNENKESSKGVSGTYAAATGPTTGDGSTESTETGKKEELVKENQKVNASLSSVRGSKAGPSARPSTRDSASTRRSVRKS